jgi:phage protein D/phage baseplate assembly protein gpV
MTTSFFAPCFDIRVSGVTMAANISSQVLGLVVETDLDLAGTFTITLRNVDNRLLDSALFDLGKTVEIHIGYDNQLEPAILGEIASIEPIFPQDGPPIIRITGYDKSFRMRRGQPEPTEYKYMTDSLIAARIAVENGLIPVVDPTPSAPHRTITQVESDMAFLKARAQDYFFDVYVEWDRLHFQFPRPQAEAHVLEWGKNLSSFSPRISSSGLAGLQVIRGYNQELAQTIYGIALAADFDLDNLEERVGSAAVDLLAGLVRKGIRKNSIENPLDAMVLAKSLLAELLEGMYEGTGTCIGMPPLAAGRYVTIRGVGKRFSGTYRLRKVVHRIDDNGFHTEFSITQRSHTSVAGIVRKHIADLPSPTQPERFYGVVLAEVRDNYELSDAQVPIGRVKVSFPGLSENFTSGWAPCAQPMGGDSMGFYALPEKGDQVLVAFDHGDLSKPYVLGSLWNAKNPPPVTNLDGANNKRVIKSRAGHTITFDDTADTGQLVIKDKIGNSITLDATTNSITISSKGNLSLEANGSIDLKAPNGINVTNVT